VLLGITYSATDDLKNWREEVGLAADLLCDTSKSVAIAYGAAENAEQERPKRISVLVGPDGKVVKTYGTPDSEAHPAEVLADLA